MFTDDVIIQVRRQWNDWRSARYRASDIEGWRWDRFSGGVNAPAPQPFVHAYVSCDAMIGGDLRTPACTGRSASDQGLHHQEGQ